MVEDELVRKNFEMNQQIIAGSLNKDFVNSRWCLTCFLQHQRDPLLDLIVKPAVRILRLIQNGLSGQLNNTDLV